MSFVAYQNFIYRIATCSDLIDAGQNIEFEVLRTELVRKEVNGNTRLIKEKKSIFNNKTDNLKNFYKFRVKKTEKLFVKVTVPGTSSAEENKNEDSQYVCVGVLLEHSRVQKTGF